jgi:hypothetical protein
VVEMVNGFAIFSNFSGDYKMDKIYTFQLENKNNDYIDFGIPGIDSYKVKDEDTIILAFHSSEKKTSRHYGLLQAAAFYAKHLGKGNKVVVFTCFASKTNLPKYITENCEIIPAFGKMKALVDQNSKLIISESGRAVIETAQGLLGVDDL